METRSVRIARAAAALVAAALAAAAGACVEKTSYLTPDESEKVAKNILDKAPARIEHRLDAELDGKIVLLGYALEPAEVTPGGAFTVTWYWQVKEAPGPGYRLFTHALDGKGESRINRDAVGPIRKSYQPEHWKAGTVIRDPQKIAVPKSWGSSVMELRVGVFGREGRMRVTKGKADKENRIKGPRVPVVERVARPPLAVPWTATPPVIDGAIDGDPAWAGAAALEPFADTLTGEPAPRKTEVRLLWGDAALYVAVRAEDVDLRSEYTQRDEELWHQDAFEIFLDPRGDRKDYYEVQVSPAGVLFDSRLARYRKNDNAWNGAIVAAAKVDGSLNDGAAGDKGWTAELAIPFDSIKEGGGVPPGDAAGLKVNFFRVDLGADGTEYGAWSPPLRGDFHALDRFREIALVRPAAPAPAAAPDAGVAPKDEAKPAPKAKAP